MINISPECLQALKDDAVQHAEIKARLINGKTLTLTDADLILNGLEVENHAVCGEQLEVGSMTAAVLKLTLDNEDGRFNDIFFAGAELTVKLLIPLADGTSYPISYGVYTVDEQPRTWSTIEIEAYDNMVKLDIPFDKTQVQTPATLRDIVHAGIDAAGLSCTGYSMFPNGENNIDVLKIQSENPITWRQVLMWCCQCAGVCGFANGNGYIQFGFYKKYTPGILQTESAENLETEKADVLFIDGAAKGDFPLPPSLRFIDGMHLDESDCVLTGHQFKVGELLYPANAVMDYGILTENNLVFAAADASARDSFADTVNQLLAGFTYRPYACNILSMPQLQLLDSVDYDENGQHHHSIVTNYTFRLNGFMNIEAKAKSQVQKGWASLGALTPGQQAIIDSVSHKVESVQSDLTSQESATLHLNQTAASAMGMYYSERTDENGGVIRYWHDNESLENSLYICMQNAGGSFSTNTGWNNGNPHWTTGTNKFGNAVVNLLNTIGIQAEWIQADSITTDKLSIGQSERGTNLLEDSSFEHGGAIVRATETEDAVVISPAHNNHWNAVAFQNSDSYDVQYRVYLEIPSVGGFDGNKAILDVNLKGILEGEDELFIGYEQIQPIPIEMLTHTVSFYARVHRYPIGTPQGTEIAHAKYAFKIQWLDRNGVEISCTFQSFSTQSNGTDAWDRFYASVNPPNGTVSAKFAIGFVCTDSAGDDYLDLAFCDLDGILFEAGTSLNTWTCSAAELKNTGVIINSNGVNIADGKISVTDVYGRKVLYTDGGNHLQLVGGLTAQMYDPSEKRVYAQLQVSPSNERNPYTDSSGYFDNSFLGQMFTRFDKNGTAEKVGYIGMTFTEDANIDNKRPMDFYSENGFAFSGNGFSYNQTRPLICDPVEIGENAEGLGHVINPGWYTVSSDARAASLKQSPVKKAFSMQVCQFGNYVLQYLVARDGETHQRVFDITQSTIPGYNWYSLTGTDISETGIGDLYPGVYIQSKNAPSKLVQESTDTSTSEYFYPTTDTGIFECFWGDNNTKYHRYTTWKGEVWCRNHSEYGWSFWRKNNVKT